MTAWTEAEKDALLAETARILNRGDRTWYEIREGRGQRSDAEELSRRAASLIAETEAILRRDAGHQTSKHRPAPSAPYDLRPEVVANLLGPALGLAHGHDPYRLAKFLGLPVYRVPHGELQINKTRPDRDIWGVLVRGPGPASIQLSDRAHGRKELLILAHECGHHLLGVDATEADCHDFARRFLKINDSEYPSRAAATWRRWQEQALEGQRQAAKVAALARR